MIFQKRIGFRNSTAYNAIVMLNNKTANSYSIDVRTQVCYANIRLVILLQLKLNTTVK